MPSWKLVEIEMLNIVEIEASSGAGDYPVPMVVPLEK